MKKIFIALGMTLTILINIVQAVVADELYWSNVTFSYGDKSTDWQVLVSQIVYEEDSEPFGVAFEAVEKSEVILNEAAPEEDIFAFGLAADAEDKFLPVKKMSVEVRAPLNSGRLTLVGKDYRVFRLEEGELVSVNIDTDRTDAGSLCFDTDRFGTYVVYYDPHVYEVEFYLEEPEYDDVCNPIYDPESLYVKIDGMKLRDDIDFPPIPQKEGFVFTGWQYSSGLGPTFKIQYIGPQPIKANQISSVFAAWVPEDEYAPIAVTLSAEDQIIKGEEDGVKVILQVSEGFFINDEDFPSEWRPEYETEEDWKSQWNIVGSDEIMVEKSEKIDDKTVELTLSGNSSDIYTSSDIYIEFNSNLLVDEKDGVVPYGDKIQLDEDGIKRAMYISDNAITLTRQKRPGGGGSLAVSQYIVSFDTLDGSEAESVRVANNAAVAEPQEPQREGYTFAGWYTDPECTDEYDFNTKVTKNITLYAKWEEADPGTEEPEDPNQGDVETDPDKDMIKLTIGERDAVVFGETKTNDVAPLIRSDRAFLPSRFIAESLGADVEWDNDNRKVTITKDETMIEITIDSDTAVVNGEEIELDAAAFIENDRTYTPIRFISENLGAKVDWDPDTRDITITR